MKASIHRLSGLLIVVVAFALVGCATTQQVGKVEPSGFLSDGDYALMKQHVKDHAVMVYFASGVQWKKFTKVYIKPIEMWKAEDGNSKLGKLSAADQQMLVDFLRKCLVDDLETEFKIVDQPGADTIVIRGAITDAKKSKPISNIASSVIPIGLAASYGKQAVTGTGLGVGDVSVEAELRDGGTNQLLAAVVDRRAGTKAWRSKFDGTWGDVKLAFHWWAQRLASRLAEAEQGTLQPI